jgi:hypothetical protein
MSFIASEGATLDHIRRQRLKLFLKLFLKTGFLGTEQAIA